MSNMEQNGAGREAEVGDVGSQLNPLQTQKRGGGIKDNVIFIPLRELPTKGLKYCLPPHTQSTDQSPLRQ